MRLGSALWSVCPPASLPPASLRPAFSPQYNKHLFVHIGQSSPSYSDPYLEAVDIRQIYDKFPEKKGGLKELFERGPSNAFFLVKFWVSPSTNSPFPASMSTAVRRDGGEWRKVPLPWVEAWGGQDEREGEERAQSGPTVLGAETRSGARGALELGS